jgi:P-type Ca2+ transporter type 2C
MSPFDDGPAGQSGSQAHPTSDAARDVERAHRSQQVARSDGHRQPVQPWHARPLDQLLKELDAGGDEGLSQAEAAARLEHFGPNELPREPAPTVWQILLRQFKSPLIYILLLAAIVSLAINHPADAAFIAVVLLVNALIGGYQEWRAEQSSRALQQLLKIRATVERDGEVQDIDAVDVVPGDIVWIESGNRVPADFRLLTAHGLEIDESLLTGESLAVGKAPDWTGAETAPVGDRRNMAFAGSIVIRGRGRGVVVNTGSMTMVGQLALDVIGATGGQPPLMHRLEKFSRMVAVVILVAAVVIGAIGELVHGYGLTDMFMFGVALAVSAIPEGLPITITIALAIATTRMARRGVIVRRLAAVEGLGSCTLIASDKTGTLTCNELTAREIRLADGRTFEVTGEGFAPVGEVLADGIPVESAAEAGLEPLLLTTVLCNEADLHHRDNEWIWHGDPTDVALLSMAHKLGWQRETTLVQYPQVNEIPFEPEHRFSATYHRQDGRIRVFVKGAPERVLAMCDLSAEGPSAEELKNVAHQMAERGFRLLAFASGAAPDDLTPSDVPPEPANLAFRGFVGMIDPLRPGVQKAVADCHNAGISVCMITGDHPVTALAISRDLGLATGEDQVVTGVELLDKSPEELEQIVRQARVFARVAPRQKLELVEAARRAGHYVAVTGDGVNDAPALRSANIGVAMGKSGTDVAREAAELVISDDNFATIVGGVEEGRVAYDNIRKVIFLLVSTGAAEVLLLGLAVIAGMPLPLLPVQILWLNLVTSGIQDKPLALEQAEEDVLRRPPRPPQEPIFNRLMIERTIVAAVAMAALGFAAFAWMIAEGWREESARNTLLLFLVLMKTFHLGAARSETKYALQLSVLKSPLLVACAIGAILVHVAAMYIPWLSTVLETEPVAPTTFALLAAIGLLVFVVLELHKWTWLARHTAQLSR